VEKGKPSEMYMRRGTVSRSLEAIISRDGNHIVLPRVGKLRKKRK
jgi:hypothetical protein